MPMLTARMELPEATPPQAGFAPDLDDRFEIARRAGVLPNLHAVVAVLRDVLLPALRDG